MTHLPSREALRSRCLAGAERMRRLWASRMRRAWLLLALFTLAAIVAVDVLLDEPVRRSMERNINSSLIGYVAEVQHVDFHLLDLSVDVEGLVLRQEAHPDPPVLALPRLRVSVHVRSLLRGKLVADVKLVDPSVHANLVQLEAEDDDAVPLEERGWQDAVQAIYPLKINELVIHGGSLVYLDSPHERPLRVSEIEARAVNIRNVQSSIRDYPSAIQLTGRVFGVGFVKIDGAADFLAKPHAGVRARVDLKDWQLAYFEPVVNELGLHVQDGLLDATGQVEYAPGLEIVDLDFVDISGSALEYHHAPAVVAKVEAAGREVEAVARRVMQDARSYVRIDHLSMKNGSLGLVNLSTNPRYRLFVSDAFLDVRNFSTRRADGEGSVVLRGRFMGSGKIDGAVALHPDPIHPGFKARLSIKDTEMKSMNDLLRAHGNLDVVEGRFSVYSTVEVRDGKIDGYVKPLFRQLDIFDRGQDRDEAFLHRAYESLAGGLAELLENRRHDEIVTVARISGSVDAPNTSTLEIVANLLRNAFLKAIPPGFREEAGRRKKKKVRAS